MKRKPVVTEAAKERLSNRTCKTQGCDEILIKRDRENWRHFALREYHTPKCWRNSSKTHPAFQPPNA